MDFIFELLLEFVLSLMGAFIGVVWPPKSLEWAVWQKWGRGLGVVAVLTFGTAIGIAWFTDGSAVVLPISLLGIVSLVGFVIVGNVCRRYHEGR